MGRGRKVVLPRLVPVLPNYLSPIPIVLPRRGGPSQPVAPSSTPQSLPPSSPSPPASSSSQPPVPRALPFFRDPQHTAPTLHLYRHLLRFLGPRSNPPFPALRESVVGEWKRGRKLTSAPRVAALLERNYELQSKLVAALGRRDEYEVRSNGSKSMIGDTSSLKRLESAAATDLVRRSSRSTQSDSSTPTPPARPRLTCSFLRPTSFNPPLPRLKPQPLGISMMIHNRLRARERRTVSRRKCVEGLEEVRAEMDFWRRLDGSEGQGKKVVKEGRGRGRRGQQNESGDVSESGKEKMVLDRSREWLAGWEAVGRNWLRTMDEAFDREAKRAGMKFTHGQVRRLESIKRQRREWKRVRGLEKEEVRLGESKTVRRE